MSRDDLETRTSLKKRDGEGGWKNNFRRVSTGARSHCTERIRMRNGRRCFAEDIGQQLGHLRNGQNVGDAFSKKEQKRKKRRTSESTRAKIKRRRKLDRETRSAETNGRVDFPSLQVEGEKNSARTNVSGRCSRSRRTKNSRFLLAASRIH